MTAPSWVPASLSKEDVMGGACPFGQWRWFRGGSQVNFSSSKIGVSHWNTRPFHTRIHSKPTWTLQGRYEPVHRWGIRHRGVSSALPIEDISMSDLTLHLMYLVALHHPCLLVLGSYLSWKVVRYSLFRGNESSLHHDLQTQSFPNFLLFPPRRNLLFKNLL